MAACTCRSYPVPDEAWTSKGQTPPPIEDRVRLIDVDLQCPLHGEGTEDWERTQARARELTERFGLT